MKVKELIEELQKFPPEIGVVIVYRERCNSTCPYRVTSFKGENEGPMAVEVGMVSAGTVKQGGDAWCRNYFSFDGATEARIPAVLLEFGGSTIPPSLFYEGKDRMSLKSKLAQRITPTFEELLHAPVDVREEYIQSLKHFVKSLRKQRDFLNSVEEQLAEQGEQALQEGFNSIFGELLHATPTLKDLLHDRADVREEYIQGINDVLKSLEEDLASCARCKEVARPTQVMTTTAGSETKVSYENRGIAKLSTHKRLPKQLKPTKNPGNGAVTLSQRSSLLAPRRDPEIPF